jgi:hypothetical protein
MMHLPDWLTTVTAPALESAKPVEHELQMLAALALGVATTETTLNPLTTSRSESSKKPAFFSLESE